MFKFVDVLCLWVQMRGSCDPGGVGCLAAGDIVPYDPLLAMSPLLLRIARVRACLLVILISISISPYIRFILWVSSLRVFF